MSPLSASQLCSCFIHLLMTFASLHIPLEAHNTHQENIPNEKSTGEPYQTNPPPTVTHRTTFYLIALIGAAVTGMVLYMYRKSRRGTPRIYLEGSRQQNRLPSVPQFESSTPLGRLDPVQASNGIHVQCDPPPPFDDPELPTYEEATAMSTTEV